MKAIQRKLSGWGNYPVETCFVTNPDSLEIQRRILRECGQQSIIARGCGRAYGDSALNGGEGVFVQTRQNRFLDFDEQSGILWCEAGLSFAEIIEHLLPRGWFLPTTPGTKFVSVGGAVAADVHGKNHHVDGSFGSHVLSLELLTGTGELIRCSRTENKDVFWATIGGMGLTGVIHSVRFRLKKVDSAFYSIDYHRTANIDDTLAYLAESDQKCNYSVAWLDCLSSGGALGRAVIMSADTVAQADLPQHIRQRPFQPPRRLQISLPFFLPSFVLNGWSVKCFNALFYAWHVDGQRIVDFETFFYPLDSILHWNRMYGKRGLVQYQALLPTETATQGMTSILKRIAKSGLGSFLAVLKHSGPANDGILSFMKPGYTLAVDFPRRHDVHQLTGELDDLLIKYDGRVNLAKDSMLTAAAFARMYPRLPEFKRIKASIDPENRFVSSQARRLGIVNER